MAPVGSVLLTKPLPISRRLILTSTRSEITFPSHYLGALINYFTFSKSLIVPYPILYLIVWGWDTLCKQNYRVPLLWNKKNSSILFFFGFGKTQPKTFRGSGISSKKILNPST
uniref:Uncharacterized protein n=1 Tax=Oryza brachyantha TaxID=4533 RepID=J3MG06_ORYBR